MSGNSTKKRQSWQKNFCFTRHKRLSHNLTVPLIVRFTAGGALEMAWHLYTWGGHVTVIKPKNFLARVKQMRDASLP